MKKILVLVDFTHTALVAFEQASLIAIKNKSRIVICHIIRSNKPEMIMTAKEKLKPYEELLKRYSLEYDIMIEDGKLFSTVSAIVVNNSIDLVVVGTHGLNGIRQNLFGADIYKLVKAIHAPTLVVNDQTNIVNGAYKKVLLPVAAHEDYLVKVKQTCKVLSKDGKVIIFAILKPGVPLDENILRNIESAKQLMDELRIDWEYQEVNSKVYSVGYVKEILKYCQGSNFDLISIMTRTATGNEFLGKMDKENLLVNDQGLPVLCSNN